MGTYPSGSAMPHEVVMDASVWASRVLPNDANHLAAKAWVDAHIGNGGLFIAPQIIIVEIASAVRRQSCDPTDARKAVDTLYSLSYFQLVPLDQTLLEESTDLAVDYGLRGADAMYVAVARRLGLVLVTFDTYQLKQDPTLLRTIRP